MWLLGASGLEWIAPAAECPRVAAVEGMVVRLAGRLPEPDELAVEATVVPGDVTGWTLHLVAETDGQRTERRIDGDTCDALAKATAIIVAVALDPVGTAAAVDELAFAAGIPDAPSSGATDPTPAPAPPSTSGERELDVRRNANEPRRVRALGGLGAGLVVATVPSVSGGPVAAVGLGIGRFRVEARGGYWAPRLVELRPGVGARVQGGAAGVHGCGEPDGVSVSWPLCVGIEAGGLQADGVGVANETTARFVWRAAVLSAGLRWWVARRVALRTDLELAIPFSVARVILGPPTVEAPVVLHATAPVSPRLVFGVEFGGRR
jgi:hypothetical protein